MGETEAKQSDSIWKLIQVRLERNGNVEPIELAQMMFHRLHLIGAVGLKLSSSFAWQWIHQSGRPVQPHSIDMGTKVEIHPMLHFALRSVTRAKSA
ncbi:MAG: hypothetical protein ACJASV_002387 [Pseudorhodobacter sp.]|jgi:hypothetical protein